MDYLCKWLFGDQTADKNKYLDEKIKDDFDHSDQTPPMSPFKSREDSGITRSFKSPDGVTGNDIQQHMIRLKDCGYEVISLVGSGSFGKCYEVKKLSDGSKLAVKIMYLGEFDKDDKLFKDFSNEVWILSEVPHINIISLVNHFMYDRLYTYTVLEFAEKGTLEHRLKLLEQPLTEVKAKLYFLQISRAIEHLHRMGIAHRDIKMSNILITFLTNHKEVIKVADFGLSRVSYLSNYGTVMTNRAVGTIYYMSPQILALFANVGQRTLGHTSSHRTDPFIADVWALGVCLYYMLVKKYPFEDTDKSRFEEPYKESKITLAQKILRQQKRRKQLVPKPLLTQITKECHHLLLDTLEVDKEKRIQMTGIVRNLWFDEWLNNENVSDINQIDLKTFLDKF